MPPYFSGPCQSQSTDLDLNSILKYLRVVYIYINVYMYIAHIHVRIKRGGTGSNGDLLPTSMSGVLSSKSELNWFYLVGSLV